MKKMCFLGMFLLIVSCAKGTIWTVDNNSLSGQFTTIQAAYDSASTGDTLLISGSPLSYGNILIKKGLTLIGPGFNPQGLITNSAYLNVIKLDTCLTNIVISGFVVYKIIISENNISNIIIRGNQVNDSLIINGGDTIDIYKNIFNFYLSSSSSVNINNHANVLISNNIFSCPAGANAIINSNQSSVIINNNIFTGHFMLIELFFNVSNAQFANNIFYGKSPSTATYSNFTNNISYGNIDFIGLNNTSTGVNNIYLDPQFMYTPIDNAMYQFFFIMITD